MTSAKERHDTAIRPLGEQELDRVSGGMTWDHDHVSADVIDARGGSFTILGLTFTFDVKGKISSIG